MYKPTKGIAYYKIEIKPNLGYYSELSLKF